MLCETSWLLAQSLPRVERLLTVRSSDSLRSQGMLANEKSKGMGDHEEGMDLADEVDMGGKVSYHAAFSVVLR